MNAEMAMVVRRNEERDALRTVIQAWNANRLDLFELSEPNDDLEFHGVMRFYFQDSGQKVATKCIRVASDATAQVVIETLIEKFRPDMRMLSIPEYALYEIHENGEERRLENEEKPLLVQLNWHKDDREGRFLLRRIDDKTNMPEGTFQEAGSSFRRKLSKREKKQLKKQEKLNRMKSTGGINDENDSGVAEKLYTELPETSFTRSISNPEAVMRRRRQQILERKLQQFRSKDGGPDTGGTLKIYGESLCRDVPYKTLLLSVRDSATQVVKEMLNKYGLDREDPHNYCLVQVNTAIEATENKDPSPGNTNTINNREYILDEDECPLAILMNHPQSRGSIMFHVRRRPADYHPRKRKKKPQQKWNQQVDLDHRYDSLDRLPYFLELNPDGSEIAGSPRRHRLQPNVTEVGSERASPHSQSQSLQLFGPNVQPRHCVIAHTEGIVTVTPCSRDAETYVNGQRIYETTILQSGMIVQFGRIHSFRFLDPCQEDRRLRQDSSRPLHDYSYDRQSTQEESSPGPGAQSANHSGQDQVTSPGSATVNYETTFDVDGNIETRSTSSQGNRDDTRSQRSVGSSRDSNRLSNYDRYPRGTDPILPAVLEIREETEEALLHALVTDLEPNAPAFKLAPSYTLYLAARYRASTHYRPELTPTERAHKLTLMLARVAIMIHNTIQERYCEVKALALWLANSSELLHFLKSDRHISAFSLDAQDTLADAVQIAFRHLVGCLQRELAAVMNNFLSERDDIGHESEDPSTASVLGVMSSAMALLRRCRVNAALTIQLFSQLFHFVNVWAFNRVVAPNSTFCSRVWGLRIQARLAQIEAWAERQGLELAADCHLARLMQAAHLLQAPKYTADDLATLSSTCFKLNSLQLRALLQKYQPSADEPRLPHEMIENVVRVAENLADELARSDGREVRLEEDPELALPFLLPEDGYSCEVVRGVPQGLVEFISPLQHAGLCRLTAQPTSNGLWTVYMGSTNANMVRSPSAMSNRSGSCPVPQQEPEIQVIKLHKSNNGMGLSIVAAKGAGQDRLGIYIKSVVKGGAADADGRLQAGDQLLKVDGQSLVGITQEKAAEYLVRTGPVVSLEVAKQGAIFHGLATLLSQPSPVMGRANISAGGSNGPGKHLRHSSSSSSTSPPANYTQQPIAFGRLAPSLSLGHLDRMQLSLAAEFNERSVDWSLRADVSAPQVELQSQSASAIPVIRLEVTTEEPVSSNTNLLSVPAARVKCYKIPPDNDLCLCEDIFQQHQARLINCDSEDAKAISRRKMKTSRSMPGDTSFAARAAAFENLKSKIDQATDVMSPRNLFKNNSLEDVNKLEDTVRDQAPPKVMKRCKSDMYLSKSNYYEFVEDEYETVDNEQQDNGEIDVVAETSTIFCDVAEKAVLPTSSSTSSLASSECGCENETVTPKSTSSVTSNDDDPVTEIETAKVGPKKRKKPSLVLLPQDTDSKLTAQERQKVLKELDDIVSGSFLKISEFGEKDLSSKETTNKDMNEFLNSMLKLDLSSLKDSSSDSDVVSNLFTKNSESSDDEVVQFGSGRVAALAKHFSKMGEAGIIRGRGGPRTKDRSFQSVPDITSLPDTWNGSSAFIMGDKKFGMIFTTIGAQPLGFSMDRLLDIGESGVVLTELPANDANDSQLKLDVIDSPDNEFTEPILKESSSNLEDKSFQCCSPLKLSRIYEVPESECNTPTALSSNDQVFFNETPSLKLLKGNKHSTTVDYPRRVLERSKAKAINVDEVDMKKLRKHNSMIELGINDIAIPCFSVDDLGLTVKSEYDLDNNESEVGAIARLSEHGKSKMESFRKFSGRFCSSEEIHKTFGLSEEGRSKLEGYKNLGGKFFSSDEVGSGFGRQAKMQSFRKLKQQFRIPDDLKEDDSGLSEAGRFKLEGFKKLSGRFCSTDHINNRFGGLKEESVDNDDEDDDCFQENIRRWTSVDCGKSSPRQYGSVERPRSSGSVRNSTDVDSGKNSLRRIQRLDAIRSRKMRRLKKLDPHRSFVVTPVRHPCISLDRSGDQQQTTDSGDDGSSPVVWWKRRSSVPEPSSEQDGSDLASSPGPRRMSERDIPSRVLSENQLQLQQQQPMQQPLTASQQQLMRTGQPMYQPAQIQSSKSVPALHSGASNEPGSNLAGPQQQQQQQHHQLGPGAAHGGAGGPQRTPHEVFNPGYSRTSSTNSLPQKIDQPNAMRSRSSQNLLENRLPAPSSNLGVRQVSNPSLLGQQQPQNHPPLYLPYQHQMSMQQQHQQQQQQQHQQQLQQQQQNQQQQQQSSAQITSPEGERFYQNLSVYRNQEINNGYFMHQNSNAVNSNHNGTPGSGRVKLPSPQDERSPGMPNNVHIMNNGNNNNNNNLMNNNNNKSFKGSQSSLSTSGRMSTEQMMNANNINRDRPSSAYLPPHGNHLQQNMVPRSQSSRDMLRQEAKLQEMGEEVRRRETRVTSPQQYPVHRMPALQQQQQQLQQQQQQHHAQQLQLQQQQQMNNRPSIQQHPQSPQQQQMMNNNVAYTSYGSPVTAQSNQPPYPPQPGAAPGQQQQHDFPLRHPPVGGGKPLSRPMADIQDGGSYSESPTPPPPPPTATHPLYQRNDGPRYAASMGEPPRGGYYTSSPSGGQQPPRAYQFQGTNPWEREEREKEALRRREAARQWRDQQIGELVSLGTNRNSQQEEQLRALRLEREFQRRAALEEDDDDEEDQESAERVQGLLRVATTTGQFPQTDDSGSTVPNSGHIGSGSRRIPASSSSSNVGPRSPPQVNGIVGRTSMPPNSHPNNMPPTGPGAEEKERLRRLKDLKMKQAEMEAEGRMKRRDEELRQQQQQHHQQQQQHQQQRQQNVNNSPAGNNNHMKREMRLDNLIVNTPNGYAAGTSPPQQRLDTLLGQQGSPPQPPERGSSFAIMSQSQLGSMRSPVSSSQSQNTLPNNSNNNSSTPTTQIVNNNNNINANQVTPVSTTTTTNSVGTAKRVSFQDTTPTVVHTANHTPSSTSSGSSSNSMTTPSTLDNIREDPNNFINEAETMLASPKSPDTPGYTGNTPGVIGAQEVYKDPRQRRLLEQHQKLMSNKVGTVPEKLSFKEKMKMFAMETGEEGTPRDKVKISRAQRDIDNLGTPIAGAPNPGNSTNNGNGSSNGNNN